MTSLKTEYLYTVKFIGDHLTLFTTVQASDEEYAKLYAKEQLLNYHGIDADNIGAWGITVEEDGEFL